MDNKLLVAALNEISKAIATLAYYLPNKEARYSFERHVIGINNAIDSLLKPKAIEPDRREKMIAIINKVVEETLYPAMEDYALDIVIGKGPSARSLRLDLPKFTIIG